MYKGFKKKSGKAIPIHVRHQKLNKSTVIHPKLYQPKETLSIAQEKNIKVRQMFIIYQRFLFMRIIDEKHARRYESDDP